MRHIHRSPVFALLLLLAGCASDGSFDAGKAVMLGAGVLQATTLDEDEVKQAATLAAQEMDSQQQIAAANNPYSTRLTKIVKGMDSYGGLNLNFKVYITSDVNAFAMADGTVRVYSGLLDAMPDDQVFAVIGHEVGHVAKKHSYNQMRKQILTSTAFQTIASSGGTLGQLTSSELGALAYQAINAKFSKEDELEADTYSVKMLKALGKDPYAMKRAIETLEKMFGSGGGFLSSHPSNKDRKANLQNAIDKL